MTGIIWKKLWQHAQSWLNNNITRLVHGNSSNGQLTETRIDTMRYVNSSPSRATQNTGRYAPDYTNWIAPRKGIQDSVRFWIQRRAFQIPGTGLRILCQWYLDSRFLELYTGFQISKIEFPDSGILYMGETEHCRHVTLLESFRF